MLKYHTNSNGYIILDDGSARSDKWYLIASYMRASTEGTSRKHVLCYLVHIPHLHI